MTQNLCSYGCNKVSNFYVTKHKKPCCSDHYNKCEAVRMKNSNGLKASYITSKKQLIFTDEHRQRSADKKLENVIKDMQSESPQYRCNNYLKQILQKNEIIPYICSICNISKWRDLDIMLELDHIDGNASNNNLSNLRLLCPNCHSQTPTFRGRNINSGKKKVSDEELIKSLKETQNIRQALINVGLSPRGGNYTRASKLLLSL